MISFAFPCIVLGHC